VSHDTLRAGWEHFAHDADIGLVGVGPTKAEAFRQAALALTGVVTDPALVRPGVEVQVACHAPNDEILLADWLNALVYEMSVRRMLFADFTLEIAGRNLRGVATGEPVDTARHEPAVEVKGVTLTGIGVAPVPGGWRVQCVVDV
jgi:SHS2 domain-containing protein